MQRFTTIFVIAACLLGGQVWARVALGIKGGLSAANVSVSRWEGKPLQTKYGMAAGLIVEIPTANRYITVRCEGMYVQKGAREKDSYDEQYYDGSIYHSEWDQKGMIDEIVLAPFFVVRVPTQSVTPFFEIGPEIGFNTRRDIVWTSSHRITGEYPESESRSGTDRMYFWDKTNLGLNLGVGMAVPSGKGEMILDLRYNIGLKDMNTTSPSDYYGDEHITATTHAVQLLIGYNFSVPIY